MYTYREMSELLNHSPFNKIEISRKFTQRTKPKKIPFLQILWLLITFLFISAHLHVKK